jgi:acyl-CoA thioester hydrolase
MKKITFDSDIYSYQIDCNGQVHNTVYFNWMEIGRLKILDAIGLSLSTLLSQGSIPTLTHTAITFKTPLFLNNRVWIEIWLSAIGYRSIIIYFNFYNSVSNNNDFRDRTLVAEGYQKSVFIDKDSLKSRLLTRKEKDAFLPYLKVQPVSELNLLPRHSKSGDRKDRVYISP